MGWPGYGSLRGTEKMQAEFGKIVFWTEETKFDLYQSDGKTKVGRLKGTAQEPCVICETWLAATGTGSLALIDSSSRINSEA